MISFIIPTYNAETYLRACVKSVLAQTVRDIEVILIDDGSTDSSWTIAQKLCAQDPRVHAFQQTHAGQSAARNNGLEHAQGEFIAFVDADDALAPEWSARHLAAIEGVDYVQSGYKRMQGAKTLSKKLPSHRYQFVSPCMRLYRRTALQGLSFAEGLIYEDVLFSLDLWLTGATCRQIFDYGYLYTHNPHSTTSRPHPEARKKVYRALREKAKTANSKGKFLIFYTLLRLYTHFLIR